MDFNEQRFRKVNLWIGATLLALSVLFLILGVTTAHGEEKATVPPQEEVTPKKAVPPGYSSGVHFRAVKSVCGPQSGLVAILNTKKMEPVFRGGAVQNYMFNGGETPIKIALFINGVVLGFCGWYIKFLQESFAKEREAMMAREGREEEQLIEIVKSTSAAFMEVKTALVEQTAAMRMLIDRLK